MNIAARVENPLAQLSFTPDEADSLNKYPALERARRLSKNLRTYENEVLEDRPVSLVYEIDEETIQGFDPRERGGVFIDGFQRMRGLLAEHPGEVVLWYSPAGPAAFDRDPSNPYSEITFRYGQLYVQYSDGDKERAMAVKVKDSDLVERLMPGVSAFASNLTSQEARIKFMIKHPQVTGLTVDEFLGQEHDNIHVYTNNMGESFGLDDVFRQLREGFAKEADEEPDEKILNLTKRGLTKDGIFRLYVGRIHERLVAIKSRFLQMEGSCGGKLQTLEAIVNLLKLDSSSNIFSTGNRKNFLAESTNPKDDPNLCRCSQASGPHFHCPGKNETCRHPIVVGEGTSQCPSCGEGKRC